MTGQIDPSKAPSANLPVIPDKVAKAIQDGKDVSLESISEAASEIREKAGLEKAKPLDARTLTPITRHRANQIVSGSPDGKLQRGVLPRAPATRRVIPAPFQRERIEIRVPGEPRPEWRNVRADQVRPGDIVPGVGMVMDITRRTRHLPAEDQVPISFREAAEWSGVDPAPLFEKTFDAEDSKLLIEAYGSTNVAVGTDVILTGPEGCQAVLDERESVQVFGLREEAPDT
jgi:hypothetical protein